MLQYKKYTCVKCGHTFTKAVGGIVMTPVQIELELRPVCDRCKIKRIADVLSLSADCNASIAERHGESYYHYHQGIMDKRSIPTNVNIPDNEKAAHSCLAERQTVDGGSLLF